MKNRYTKEKLIEAIEQSFSIAETCRVLGIRPVGGNYKTLHSRIKEYGLDISHFTGQGWNRGLKFRPMKVCSLEEILVENSTYSNSMKLKKKLFDGGMKEQICECCGNTEWQNKPIPLEIHHINGINTDNRIENLQILCSNCHAQTKNFRKGKSALSEKRDVEYRKFKEALTSNVDGNLEPNLNNEEGAETRHDTPKTKSKKKPDRFCDGCGKILNSHQKKYCSNECYIYATKGKRPNVFELIEKFKEYKSFVKVGEHYGVTDNAVRRWCNFYRILDMVKE